MSEKTILEEIDTTIQYHLNRLPYPLRGEVKKVYDDNKHIDLETRHGVLKYVETVGVNPVVGGLCVLLFLGGTDRDYVALI